LTFNEDPGLTLGGYVKSLNLQPVLNKHIGLQ